MRLRSAPCLRAEGRRANALGDVAERGVDLVGVIGWLVVEQHRERRLDGRGDAVGERLSHCGAVLLVSDRQADEAVAEGIDHELDVEAEAGVVDGDGDRPAVADPLCSAEEGLEGAAQRALVGGAFAASLRLALAVDEEDVGDERAA